VLPGQKIIFKQGSKVPIVTAIIDAETSTPKSQVQYQDVGILIEATADEIQNGVHLRSKVSQSSLAEEKSGLGAQDPIIRETVLEGISTLVLGKPLILGSFDIPGSTRKQSVEVVIEFVR
jgi:type II secretory pathway component GspD/PulD (secretin)